MEFNPEPGEGVEETRRLRRLQIMVSLVQQVIAEDPGLSLQEASELAESCRTAALALFPGKELAYDLIYRPRLQRLLRERYHLQ